MAQAIAVVVAVTGRAFARDVKGNLRPLKAGDTLQEGEVVITMAGGQVELAMADGAPMTVTADQVVTLTAEVSATSRPGREDAQVSQDTVDQIIQALEQGGNLDDIEAPAAGLAGGGGGEGNNFVRLLRISEGVSPLEFEYAQETTALLEPEEPAPIAEEPEPIGTTITLGDVTVFEGTGTATITATVSSPVTGSDLVITLSNGAIIVIPVGSTTGTSTPFPIQGEDPYIDAETFPVSVVDTSGSGFSTVTPTGPATVTVNDTIDQTNSSLNVKLEAAPSLTEDGDTLTYLVTLSAAVRPGDDPVTITFTDIAGNTQTITITEGTTGSLNVTISESLFEDVYKEADAVLPVATNVTLSGGSNFEALNPPSVGTVTLVDTIDTIAVTLDDVTVSEGSGTATITAHVTNAVTDTDLVITLSNGASVTIPVGATSAASTPFAVQGDDPYVDGESYTVSITGTTGGNFEELNTSDTATVTVNDTTNITAVTLDDVTVSEGSGTATITAHVTNAVTDTDLVITLSNGASVTIPVGATSAASTPFAVQGDDPYVDGESYTVSITGTTGGNFEELNTSDTATVTVNDTTNITAVTLDDVTVSEGSGTATITAHVTSAVTDTDLVITLSNGASVTIPVGATSAASTPFAVQGDDPYVDGESYTVSITGTTGGNFEELNTSDTATVTVNDTTNITAVTLDDVTVSEGSGTATITAHVTSAVTDTDLVITLSNGASVTIPVGATSAASTPFAVQGDDPYVDGESYTVSITGTTGGNFEELNTSDTATVTVNDTTNITAVTLDDVTVSEGSGTATITAHVTNAVTDTDLVITLSNGASVTIPVGATSAASTPFAVQGDDPYVDGESYTVSITGTTGGNFEELNTSDTATVTVNDTTNITAVTLDDVTVSEGSGTATITAHVTNAVTDTDLVITLSNGASVTIPVGATSAASTPFAVQGDDPYVDGESYTVSITGTTGGNFEELNTSDTATVTVNDTTNITAVTLDDVTVSEGSGTATITAHVTNAVTDTDLVITLSNGASVTIPIGATSAASTPFAVQGDDPYVDGESYTVSITGTTGGNFEELNTSDTATVTVNDTTNITAVTLDDVTVSEGSGTATITAHVTSAVTDTDLVITLSNGASVTIPVGATSAASTPFAVQGDDPYVDGESYTVSITGTTGGNFEELNTSDTATVTVDDTIGTTTATLTGTSSTLPGGTITYTVTLDHEVRADDAPVVVTLSNSLSITISSGTTESITVNAPNDGTTPAVGPVTVTTVSQTVSGTQGSFEFLASTGTVTTDIDYTPSITTSNQIVDETGGLDTVSGLLAVNYGGDNPGTLALAASNATWTAGTNTLTANDGSWKIVVNSNGTYTFTQLAPLTHPVTTDSNDPITLSITASVTDADGTPASTSFTVAVLDDGPTTTQVTNLTFSNQDATTGASGTFAYEIGTDARTTYSASSSDFHTITLASGFVGATPIAIGANPVNWVSETSNEAVFSFTFQYAANPLTPGILSEASGQLIFDKDADTYTVKLDDPVESFTVLNTGSTMAQESYNLVGEAASQPEIVVSKLAADFYVRFTGTSGPLRADGDSNFTANETFTGTQDYVNVNTTQNGVGDGVVGPGEVLNMEFYTSSPGSNQSPGNGTARADGLYLKIAQFQGKEDFVVVLKLIDPEDSTDVITRAIVVSSADVFTGANPYGIPLGNGEGVVIIESNDFNFGDENYQIYGAQLLSSTESVTGSGINLNPLTGSTGGSSLSDTQAFGTTSGSNTTGTSDNDVIKFTDIGFLSSTTSTQDTKLTFGVTVGDADGDTTAAQTLNVTIEGNTHFLGTATADTMYGSDGNDTLQAGAGNDTMFGDLGADTFKWALADANSASVPTDTIKDFNTAAYASGGDRLDLKDLLEGLSPTNESLDNYLHFSKTGTSTTIEVHSGGNGTPIDQVIVLENVDLVTGFANDAAIITDLMTKGKLITD
ncbi:retention module-containing protein [Aromatoleum evansii]|uniref:Retention module-containing protein n=1 Tax=Aromatoleum evansii TaxID=59406 RepID=A0ABZ1AMB6_AROEV|nr:retention module-containing protein [Aromatoleum evansii]